MINLHRFPVSPTRSDFTTEEEYQYAIEHYDELVNMAEDIAMEEHYEKQSNKHE